MSFVSGSKTSQWASEFMTFGKNEKKCDTNLYLVSMYCFIMLFLLENEAVFVINHQYDIIKIKKKFCHYAMKPIGTFCHAEKNSLKYFFLQKMF